MEQEKPHGMMNSEARKRMEEHKALVAPFIDLPIDTIALPVDMEPVKPYAIPDLNYMKVQIQREARYRIRRE